MIKLFSNLSSWCWLLLIGLAVVTMGCQQVGNSALSDQATASEATALMVNQAAVGQEEQTVATTASSDLASEMLEAELTATALPTPDPVTAVKLVDEVVNLKVNLLTAENEQSALEEG